MGDIGRATHRRGIGVGLWLASLGMMLQLVGLSWDAVQHYLDPGLAARESVFTLTNQSHLLVSIGLSLTTGGLLLLLVQTGWRRPRHGFRPGRLVAAAALGLLFVSVSALGLASGGEAAGQHAHSGGATAGAAGGTAIFTTPTFGELRGILRTEGLEPALTRLEAVAAADEGVLVVAHDYAHALGKLAHDQYGSAPQAFGRCRETFQSGCYHGVLERYLEENPQLGQQEIVDLCDGGLNLAGAANVLRFQCLHGLGHGLTGNYQHDLLLALRACDLLRTEWDRSACYGGAFMENIVFSSQQLTAVAGQPGHDHGSGHRGFLRAEDPLYPCNALDERYKPECYIMQTSPILMFNGYDFAQAALECDQAGSYAHLCYQSLGRDASSTSYRDPAQALQLCAQGNPAYLGYCLLGAGKNMIDVTWKIDQALELCASAAPHAKELCYTAIGEQLANLHQDQETKASECARAERDYILPCNRGAGLT
jgi:hypothetical protein